MVRSMVLEPDVLGSNPFYLLSDLAQVIILPSHSLSSLMSKTRTLTISASYCCS